jgi:hypothetical protein
MTDTEAELMCSIEVITIYGILRLPEKEAPPMAH